MRKGLIVMLRLSGLGLSGLGLSGQALAQSADPLRTGTERRVSAGIAIPFGARGTAETPQLELRSTAIRHDGSDWAVFGRDGWLPRRDRTARIGFTLERSPRFTIGGREMEANDERHGISTLGYVAIGVGAAVIVGGLLFADALNDASE